MNPIPWESLDTFYFNEFISTLHPDLQAIATDLRILRHTEEESHITTIENVYQVQYTGLPFILNDIFQIPDDLLIQLGKAWICHFWDFVLTDSLVDNQIENANQAILLQQHIRHYAISQYQLIFKNSVEFWDLLHSHSQTTWNALSHETHCVDLHLKPYTYEDMVLVNEGKAAPFCLMVYAMSALSDNMNYLDTLKTVYDNLILSDQLVDDASDWKGDFKLGRITLPLTLCLKKAQKTLDEGSLMSEDEFDILFLKHEIGQEIASKAIALLEESLHLLEAAELHETNLYTIIQSRHEMASREIGRYGSLKMFRIFLDNLKS